MKKINHVLTICFIMLIPFGISSQSIDCDKTNKFLEKNDWQKKSLKMTSMAKLDLDNIDLSKYYSEQSIFDLSSEYSFQNVYQARLKTNPNHVLQRYQQYYNGVKVKNGGYSVVVNDEDYSYAPIGGPGPGPERDPCDEVIAMHTWIKEDINQSDFQSMGKNALDNSLGKLDEKIFNKEFEIVLNDDCEYQLIYILYYPMGSIEIDAKTGKVLSEQSSMDFLNAPTELYGDVDLEDFNSGSEHLLISPDETIFTYDFDGLLPPQFVFNCNIAEDSWQDWLDDTYTLDKIPSTNIGEWTPAIAPPGVYQAHHVVTQVKDQFFEEFENYINVAFEELHVASNVNIENAGFGVYDKSYPNIGYLLIGENNSSESLSSVEIIAHEMGHGLLRDMGLQSNCNDVDRSTLHEGISDIIGIYIDSKLSDDWNWILGDTPNVAPRNPTTDNCWISAIYPDAEVGGHLHGIGLSRFFYILSEGTADIEGIGMDAAISIILDAVAQLGPEATLLDLINMTVEIMDENAGPCSIESTSIRQAWDVAICESNNTPPNELITQISQRIYEFQSFTGCDYTISGPYVVCEENDRIYLTVNGGSEATHFQYRILGPNSTQFTMNGNSSGSNSISTTSRDLLITDFPQYNYYPQYITVEVYSPTVGPEYKEKIRIKIIDCDGDDPTCDEYYNSIDGLIAEEQVEETSIESEATIVNRSTKESIEKMVIYDLSGNLIYNGTHKDVKEIPIRQVGIYFVQYMSQDLNIIDTKKVFLLNN